MTLRGLVLQSSFLGTVRKQDRGTALEEEENVQGLPEENTSHFLVSGRQAQDYFPCSKSLKLRAEGRNAQWASILVE